jgi:hypothetical protein
MGLLDGVEKFLEDKLFKKMEEQFNELIKVMQEINNKLGILIDIQTRKG